jgi:tight adherence protein C
MTTTILLLGAALFVSFFLIFFFFLSKRASTASALLEEVTQQKIREEGERSSSPLVSALGSGLLTKPFAFFGNLFASKPDPELTRRLMLAGYRKPIYADVFRGTRLALPALLGLSVILLFSATEGFFVYFFLVIVIGFFLPDFWLNVSINNRRDRIRLSLPDGLDLMSICMEAGLGLDQAVVRVGQELRVSHRDLSDEFLQVNLEQRAGAPRLAAWRDFADRANVESVRSFVSMLIQTERFGTPISKSMGVFSDALRTQRRQKAEEMAAKTTIKLVLPLAIFIFPDTFIVTVGPAIITIIRSVSHILQ